MFYQYLLCLQSPWTVNRVNLAMNEQRVDIWAEHPEDVAWPCPHCAETLPLYDHAEERTWRLPRCTLSTRSASCGVSSKVPSLQCDACPWPYFGEIGLNLSTESLGRLITIECIETGCLPWGGKAMDDLTNHRSGSTVKVAVVGAGYWGKNFVHNFGSLNTLGAI